MSEPLASLKERFLRLALAATGVAAVKILALAPAPKAETVRVDAAETRISPAGPIGWREKIKIGVATLVGAGVLALIGAGLFLWSGLYNVAASSGHASITRIVLHRAMIQSVRRHAPKLNPPKLDDPGLVRLGAAHFLSGCAPCHGSPDFRASPIEIGATPPPPPLNSAAMDFTPSELHWIVKHGVKMTAMPAWPTQKRDDEIWSLVAFLEALKSMKPGEFAPLAGVNDAAEGLAKAAKMEDLAASAESKPCAACHGEDGQGGRTPAPKLAGLSSDYIRDQLTRFRDGSRPSGIMQPVAVGLSDAAIGRLADAFSAEARSAAASAAAPALVAKGAAIAEHGMAFGAPACNDCHRAPGASHTPLLDGQQPDYLSEQLALFRADIRKGPNSIAMRTIAKALTPEESEAVAAYYASKGGPNGEARADRAPAQR